MTKSKFAESLQGLTSEQFDSVAKDMLSEAARRGGSSSEWDRIGQMSDYEFEQFTIRLNADEALQRNARTANAAAAKVGKVLADPKAETNEGSDGNDSAA